MSSERSLESKTGGRAATTGVIPGDFSISVGNPKTALPPGWSWRLLTDVARLETGHTPSRKHPEYWGGDVPWIGIRDATGNHGATIHTTAQYTNELGIRNSSARILPANTVCLSRTASVGYVVVMGVHMATSQDFVNWVCGPQLNHSFLKYVLLAERASFLRFASGTTHQTIYFPEVKAFHIALPPRHEQDRMVAVLESLDNRITLLRQTNSTLEAIAQTLFKSWFVDFDPVRAKQQGLAPEGMDEATAALFPDSFEDARDGNIPHGWECATLGDVTSYLNRGISPKYAEDGVLVLNQKCIRDFIVDTTKARRHDLLKKGVDGRTLQLGDVLVNSTGVGTLGRVAQVLALEEKAIVDSHVTVVRASSELSWNYLGLAMMRKQPEIEALGEGTTGQTELSRGKLEALKLLVPPKSVLEAFDDVTLPLRNQFAANLAKIQTLATLRDTLLPRLVAGRLRVPEAILEEVA